MDILYLSTVFLIIAVIIWLKKPPSVTMTGGIAATTILLRVNLKDAVVVLGRQTVAWGTVDVLLSFYLIIFLQLMLEKKGRPTNVRNSSNRLLRDRRMNTIVSPAIMGLLPSVTVMATYADMVGRTCGEYMDDKNKTFASCCYRHIPEMFLPTFLAIPLGLILSGQNARVFMLATISMMVATCLVVYIIHLKGAPREMPLLEETIDKRAGIANLVKNLWTLIAVLLIIIIFNFSVYIATSLVITSNHIFDHFNLKNLPNLMVRSAEPILLGNMYLVTFFKDTLSYTGVIELLPGFIEQFLISMTIFFGLLFFIDTVISGSQTIIALCMPVAFLVFPQGRIPFPVMLVSVVQATMQISPTHICSSAAADLYHATLGDVVVRILGPVIISPVTAYGYKLLLGQIFYQRAYKQKLMIQEGKI